jgi:hypothetical protein
MMPIPIKIFLASLFLAIFAVCVILAVKNRTKSGFFVFSRMDWVDRSENEFEFVRQTYVVPIGSAVLCLFAMFQIAGA